jgi:hypothetical protein
MSSKTPYFPGTVSAFFLPTGCYTGYGQVAWYMGHGSTTMMNGIFCYEWVTPINGGTTLPEPM